MTEEGNKQKKREFIRIMNHYEKYSDALLQEETDGDDSVITLVFNISQDDPDEIRAPHPFPFLTNQESAYSPMYNILSAVTSKNERISTTIGWEFDSSVDYLHDKIIVRITNFIESNSKHPLFKEMSLIEQQDYITDAFKRSFINQGRNYIRDKAAFDKFRQSIEVHIYSKFRNLIKKLPELEGLFESSETKYVYECKFKDIPTELMDVVKSLLHSTFDLLKVKLKRSYNQNCISTITVSNGIITARLLNLTIHPNSQRQIGGWMDKCIIDQLYQLWPPHQDDKILDEITDHQHFISIWKTEFEDLTKKLPELKGIFESKSDKEIPYRLEVTFNIKDKKYKKSIKEALERVKRFFELPIYRWPNNIIEDKGNLILNVLLTEALTLNGAKNHEQVIKRIVKNQFEKKGLLEPFHKFVNITYKIVETTFDKMTAKLPELKGIFESRLDKDKRVLYVKFDPIADSAVAELLETILNKTSRYFNFWFDDQPSSVNKNGTCFTFVLDCSNIVKADTTEGGEAFFWNNYRATQEEIYRNTKIPIEVRQEYGKLVHWNFEWASKYKEMVTKLPELEGIFEAEYSSLFEKYLS